jgi:hypothetical protein
MSANNVVKLVDYREPPVKSQYERGITQEDIQKMSESELAVLASKAPPGMTPIFFGDGTFAFINTRVLQEMAPSKRATITVIGRAH